MRKYFRKFVYLFSYLFIFVLFLYLVYFLKRKDKAQHAVDSCQCSRTVDDEVQKVEQKSMCCDWSTLRGPQQNVVSYSVYGDFSNQTIKERYYFSIEDRILEVLKYYPGWIVRVYHNASSNSKEVSFLCQLLCKYSILDLCQIRSLYPQPGQWKPVNVKRLNGTRTLNFEKLLIGKMWRFSVMADPLVAKFLVRDTDAFILKREVEAVKQWLGQTTPKVLHVMRDHPSHNGVILAGMWGGLRSDPQQEELLTNLFYEMLKWPPRNIWDYDQILLRRTVWPEVLDNVMVHDSYHCQNPAFAAHVPSLPFPTKREGHLYVSWGVWRPLLEMNLITTCPVECRPQDHLDWTLC